MASLLACLPALTAFMQTRPRPCPAVAAAAAASRGAAAGRDAGGWPGRWCRTEGGCPPSRPTLLLFLPSPYPPIGYK